MNEAGVGEERSLMSFNSSLLIFTSSLFLQLRPGLKETEGDE
jgi:hypothetical protein